MMKCKNAPKILKANPSDLKRCKNSLVGTKCNINCLNNTINNGDFPNCTNSGKWSETFSCGIMKYIITLYINLT